MSDAQRHLREHLVDVLLEADQSFADTADMMEALTWIAFAAKQGIVLPPRIAERLYLAINAYTSGAAKSLDDAFGLNGVGGANPRARKAKQAELQGALARMYVLQVIGAKIEDAAVLVERLGTHKASYLASEFKRSGMGEKARAERAQFPLRRADVDHILDEYPDGPPEVAEAKAAIRAVHSDRGG
jgi:hypothetical protein